MESAKAFLQLPAAIFALLGLITIFVALATPAWQVVYARELQQWLQSGLWMSCQTRPSGMYMCSYETSQGIYGSRSQMDVLSHDAGDLHFHAWQRTLLHVFLVGQLCCIICLVIHCFSRCSLTERATGVLITVFIALAALLCVGAAVTFAIYSTMVDYRFLQVSVSGIYEKHRGYSFYIAVLGIVFYLFSLCLSLAYTINTIRKPQLNYGSVERMREQQPRLVFGSQQPQYSQEDFFAMKPLPNIPQYSPFRSSGI
uniref:Claudin n=1 Tax=Haemonchus contortus TaxID=6289 RepID=A0A7I4YDW1_HAECO